MTTRSYHVNSYDCLTIHIHIDIPMPYKQLIPKVCRRWEPKPADQHRSLRPRTLVRQQTHSATAYQKGQLFSPHGCHRPTMTVDGWNPTQKKMVMLGMVDDKGFVHFILVVNCTGSIPDWQTLAKCWLQLIKSESNFQWFWGQQLWKEANRSNSMREQCVSRPLFILFQTMATSPHLQLLAIQLRVLTQCPPTEAECNRWTARVYYANRLSMAKSSKLANR